MSREIRIRGRRTRGPQLNSLRLSSSKNLTGQAEVENQSLRLLEVGGGKARGPQLNSPRVNK
jgi:hypothetical protein